MKKSSKTKLNRSQDGMMTVLVRQEIAKSEKEAKAIIADQKSSEDCIGARIYPPAKARQKKWIVHTYFADEGGRPPVGMARLSVRLDADLARFGLKKAS